MYLKANINQKIFQKTAITIQEGFSTITFPASPNFYHALDGIHGSVYFKLLDDAAYFAASSSEFEYFLLTKTYSVEFLRPVEASLLRCEGSLSAKLNDAFEANAKLFNEQNKLVAKGVGIFVKSKVLLVDSAGYA